MLKTSALQQLQGKKNLLAFSAGVDSSALFFILLQEGILFDIAIVDYGLRAQSKEEVAYAKELASSHNLTCHIYTADKITKNFESNAREIRYNFFEELINQNSYDNLITAHHLGDRFEWMLMQFCKGAGCAEIAGMHEISKRNNYTLLRPLLHLDKEELLLYLKKSSIKYFEDASNLDEEIKRNEFRHNYAKPLLNKYLSGIKKSFEYIDEDVVSLLQEVKINIVDNFTYFYSSSNTRADIFTVDKYLKSQNYMLSASERETLKRKETTIVGRKFIINQTEKFIFIIPYSQEKPVLDKKFKDECRRYKIEAKLRPFLSQNPKVFELIKGLLSSI